MIRRVVCFIVIYFLCFFTYYQSSYAAVSPPVTKSPATNLSLNYAPTPLWQGMFNDLSNWKTNNWSLNKLPSWGSQNIEVRASTSANGTSPHGDNYLRIHYPAGSANSGSSPPLPLGGAQFYGAMVNSNTPITLSYYIRFPTNFPFNFVNPTTSDPYTLGKLPGLFGGIGNTGDHVPTGSDGWTTRYMWCNYVESTRQKVRAGGELLLFTVGSNKGLYGHPFGTNVGCNNWHFSADGQWHNLQQTIHLNDPGVANGRIDVCYDGNLVLTQSNITFRTVASLNINGILFQSFFGGSGSDYSTPTNTYVDFADFALYPYPATAAPGACISNP